MQFQFVNLNETVTIFLKILVQVHFYTGNSNSIYMSDEIRSTLLMNLNYVVY